MEKITNRTLTPHLFLVRNETTSHYRLSVIVMIEEGMTFTRMDGPKKNKPYRDGDNRTVTEISLEFSGNPTSSKLVPYIDDNIKINKNDVSPDFAVRVRAIHNHGSGPILHVTGQSHAHYGDPDQ